MYIYKERTDVTDHDVTSSKILRKTEQLSCAYISKWLIYYFFV